MCSSIVSMLALQKTWHHKWNKLYVRKKTKQANWLSKITPSHDNITAYYDYLLLNCIVVVWWNHTLSRPCDQASHRMAITIISSLGGGKFWNMGSRLGLDIPLISPPAQLEMAARFPTLNPNRAGFCGWRGTPRGWGGAPVRLGLVPYASMNINV